MARRLMPIELRRSAGVLLHPTSLPGPHGSGDLGPAAFHFVDWLVAAKQSLWQVLPLGGIGPGNSPYMSTSAFAANVLLIDLAELRRRGWLDDADLAAPAFDARRIDWEAMKPWRMERLARAAARFAAGASSEERRVCDAWCSTSAAWLDDYALFMALAEAHSGRDWCDWPAPLAARDASALAAAREQHAARIGLWKFAQWSFHRQWQRLKVYANERGVRIVGDAPIFVAHHSADVWAHRALFELDSDGCPTVVAGVPPDAFSATGQHWGNPLYRWKAHAKDGYAWWVQRLRSTLELVDWVRIDHFRGFAACWEIAASESTAMNGRWVNGPGAALFKALEHALGAPPIIAEDLGVITPDVVALRERCGYPGMRVLQFAWGHDGEPKYRPHAYRHDTVAYTGTHDNDTTIGWWHTLAEDARHHLREYFATDGHAIHRDLMRAACASAAAFAVYPMQDVLGLDGAHRMNFPGTAEGNWGWRFAWSDVHADHAQMLARWAELYGREPDAESQRTQST